MGGDDPGVHRTGLGHLLPAAFDNGRAVSCRVRGTLDTIFFAFLNSKEGIMGSFLARGEQEHLIPSLYNKVMLFMLKKFPP